MLPGNMKRTQLITILFGIALSILLACNNKDDNPSNAFSDLMEYSMEVIDTGRNEYHDIFKKYLNEKLREVKIIALGEARHDHGTTFKHKIQLIKFLHEEMGFNVLVFEYGWLGEYYANQSLNNGVSPDQACKYSWLAQSELTFPIFDYIFKTKQSDDPMQMAGFDSEKIPSGIPDTRRFIKELTEIIEFDLSPQDSLLLDSLILNNYSALGDNRRGNMPYKRRRSATDLIDSLSLISQNKREFLIKNLGRTDYYMQILTLESILMASETESSGNLYNYFRDQNMATRVQWLKDSIYPDEKIILWSATAHNARNMIGISRNSEYPYTYYNFYPYYVMGDFLYTEYGNQYYSMAFTSGEGSYGVTFPIDHNYKKYEEIIAIEPPKESSYEYYVLNSGYETLFTDLRTAKKNSWLNSAYTGYAFGCIEDYGSWSKMVDGFYFIRKMEPDIWRDR